MLIRLVILVPALAALAGLLLRRQDVAARAIAVGAAGILVVLTLVGAVLAPEQSAPITTLPALDAGGLSIPLHLETGSARAAIALIVAAVAAAVQVYSTWYLAADDRLPQFLTTVSLFTAAMLLVVHSGDLLLTIVGWEVMGWCSYLLIGHWSRRESARQAAHKAFLVTRVADIGFVLGLVGLAAGARSTDLGAVITAWARPTECIDAEVLAGTPVGEALTACSAPNATARAILLSLVVIGVLGKSAQVPFQDWLPDAMEGPTPASALIHAATMVAAGTVVLAQLFTLLSVSESARWLLGLATTMTMLLAAVLAFAQSDLKRLLAWSTVSQVAVMLSALAVAPPVDGPDSGQFHLWSHAIFKALLFLAIGWLSVLGGGTAARALRGTALAHPLARISMFFGLLSLAGVPLTVGGLSKEHVIAQAYAGAVSPGGPGVLVFVALILTAFVTAAYATRAYLVVTAKVRGEAVTKVVLPGYVKAVLGVLVALSVLGGLITLTPAFDLHPMSLLWVAVTLLVVAVGVGLTLRAGFDRDPAEVFAARFIPMADAGLGVDSLYRRLVAAPVLALARLVAFLDREVVDAYVRGVAVSARVGGWLGERAHRGERPASGIALVVGGVLVLAATGVIAWS